MTYQGYRHLHGRVVAADTGVGLADAQVVACLIDRAKRGDCSSTRWTERVESDVDGRFEIPGTRHFAIALPFPGGVPTYSMNVLVQKSGYVPRELTWQRDGELLSQQPLVIHLEPVRVRVDQAD